MEETIWEGNASAWSAVTVVDVLLSWTLIWLVVPLMRFMKIKGTHYRITNERIVVRQGIMSSNEEEIELYRVRDFNVSQGMIQKMLGIGNIAVATTDVSAPDIEMKGIPKPQKLKEQMRTATQEARRNNNVSVTER